MLENVRPRLPERDVLVRFLVERPALPLHEAATLLGWSRRKLLQEAEGALLPNGRVPWSEVAYWLLRVWPRAALLRELGDASVLIPRELHLTPVPWELPVYLVRAMQVQAVLQRQDCDELHGLDAQELVAEALHNLIDDETAAFFRNDAEFMAAYEYPEMQ